MNKSHANSYSHMSSWGLTYYGPMSRQMAFNLHNSRSPWIHMGQSQIEIKYYFVAYFERGLACDTSNMTWCYLDKCLPISYTSFYFILRSFMAVCVKSRQVQWSWILLQNLWVTLKGKRFELVFGFVKSLKMFLFFPDTRHEHWRGASTDGI